MAEEVGFEPTVDFHLRRFSRPVHSTTLPLLRQRNAFCYFRIKLIGKFLFVLSCVFTIAGCGPLTNKSNSAKKTGM